MDETLIRQIVEGVIKERLSEKAKGIPVGVSNRHVHLSNKDVETLFGTGYQFSKLKDLSQTGQYAAKETVTLIGPKGVIEGVRILGPERKESQIEILQSDTFRLGVAGVVRDSGDLEGTPGIIISGPAGVVRLTKGLIVAKRHIHMNPRDAELHRLTDRQEVQVHAGGERALIFDKVLVRVHPSFNLEFHIDIDESNAARLANGNLVEICNF